MKHKIERDVLAEHVKKSQSMGHLLELLGIPKGGGNYSTFKYNIKKFNLDTSHWETTRKIRQGIKNENIALKRKKLLQDVLVENSTYSRGTLKRRLISEKILDYKCYSCNNVTWMNHPIPLQLEHINGVRNDNRLENLTLLCPNCHALTPTYCGKNIKTVKYNIVSDETIINIVPMCSCLGEILRIVKMPPTMENYDRIRKIINIHGLTLKKREHTDAQIENFLSSRKVNRPSKDELTKLVWEMPSYELCKRFNVSDKALSKWCKFYGISKPSRGYWTKIKNGQVAKLAETPLT